MGLIRKLPRLINETATGVSRVRRRSKERGHHPDLARNFAPPQCFINHVVTPGRRFATAPLSLADVKETSKHLGVTLNDIVLATAAGALRQLLLRYDGRADSPLIAGVPVSYNTSPERLVGNEFTYMTPSLPVQIDDPLERVQADLGGHGDRERKPPIARAYACCPRGCPTFRRRSHRGCSAGRPADSNRPAS